MSDDPRTQLAALAGAACHHALERHGERIAISAADAATVERILAGSRGAPDLAALVACYGAWLGEVAVRECGAAWIGLHEATAPRLRIGIFIASPLDAVERLLRGIAEVPAIPGIIALFRAWAGATTTPSREAVLAHNREAWAALADDPRFIAGGAAPDAAQATAALDPWLRAEGVAGKDVLCLAAGGGRHAPLLASAGARVTVVDLSEAQLAHDRRAAAGGAAITVVCASLDDLAPLADASFDVVVQPVASCYLPTLERAHAELARVLRPGGLLVVQHKQPATLQASGASVSTWSHYVDGLALPAVTSVAHREAGAAEFLHTLEVLLGGLCRAGFVIEDVAEPLLADALAPPGSAGRRATILPPYLKVKARRNWSSTDR